MTYTTMTVKPGMTQTNNASCVLLADSHTVFAEGTRDLLKTAFDSVYVVGDNQSLQDGAKRLSPTVIVIDISKMTQESLALVGKVHNLSPSSKIIALVMHQQEYALQAALTAGADGIVSKNHAAFDLLKAVDAVLNDEQFVSNVEQKDSGNFP